MTASSSPTYISPAIFVPEPLPDYLQWLHDAPLYIDDDQVERFYDAVARPVVRVASITKDSGADESNSYGGSTIGETSAGLGPAAQLLTLGMLDVKLRGQLQGEFKKSSTDKSATKTELVPIASAGRQLEQLAFVYLALFPNRIKHVCDPAATDWLRPEYISATPRAIAFIDLAPGSKIIPTAAEVEGGKVVLFYEKLKGKNGEQQPPYPEPKPNQTSEVLLQKRKEYWAWFNENVSPTDAMGAVEKVVNDEKGRLRWIDYRLCLTSAGDTLHLHFTPAGKYDTGVFAYNLIKRGFKHGLRLIGTLKSEPDLNVLAVFDK